MVEEKEILVTPDDIADSIYAQVVKDGRSEYALMDAGGFVRITYIEGMGDDGMPLIRQDDFIHGVASAIVGAVLQILDARLYPSGQET